MSIDTSLDFPSFFPSNSLLARYLSGFIFVFVLCFSQFPIFPPIFLYNNNNNNTQKDHVLLLKRRSWCRSVASSFYLMIQCFLCFVLCTPYCFCHRSFFPFSLFLQSGKQYHQYYCNIVSIVKKIIMKFCIR